MRLMFEPLCKIPCTLMLTVVHVNLTIFLGGEGATIKKWRHRGPSWAFPSVRKFYTQICTSGVVYIGQLCQTIFGRCGKDSLVPVFLLRGGRRFWKNLLPGTCYNMLRTCYGEVANLLRTSYGETGVVDFGLYPPDGAVVDKRRRDTSSVVGRRRADEANDWSYRAPSGAPRL